MALFQDAGTSDCLNCLIARISYKKCRKFEFSGISDKLELVCQFLLNQAEIFTSFSLHQDKKSVLKELWNFKNWRCYANVLLKSWRKSLKIVKIWDLFVLKWHKILFFTVMFLLSQKGWAQLLSNIFLLLACQIEIWNYWPPRMS